MIQNIVLQIPSGVPHPDTNEPLDLKQSGGIDHLCNHSFDDTYFVPCGDKRKKKNRSNNERISNRYDFNPNGN